MCRIEGGASFSKAVVTDELAHKVLCSENAAFLAEISLEVYRWRNPS
jgi:hypothetical protein